MNPYVSPLVIAAPICVIHLPQIPTSTPFSALSCSLILGFIIFLNTVQRFRMLSVRAPGICAASFVFCVMLDPCGWLLYGSTQFQHGIETAIASSPLVTYSSVGVYSILIATVRCQLYHSRNILTSPVGVTSFVELYVV